MFWSTLPATIQKQKRRTKTAVWWTFTEGKGREGQRMAICQWAPPAANENTRPWLLAKPPPPPSMVPPPPQPLSKGLIEGQMQLLAVCPRNGCFVPLVRSSHAPHSLWTEQRSLAKRSLITREAEPVIVGSSSFLFCLFLLIRTSSLHCNSSCLRFGLFARKTFLLPAAQDKPRCTTVWARCGLVGWLGNWVGAG